MTSFLLSKVNPKRIQKLSTTCSMQLIRCFCRTGYNIYTAKSPSRSKICSKATPHGPNGKVVNRWKINAFQNLLLNPPKWAYKVWDALQSILQVSHQCYLCKWRHILGELFRITLAVARSKCVFNRLKKSLNRAIAKICKP